jgi:hypothetical protein
MKIKDAIIGAAKTQDAPRFRKLIEKLDSKGVPVIDLPIMMLDINAVGVKAHRWAWDQIEDWQNA